MLKMPDLRKTQIDLFWSNVDKRGADECWPYRHLHKGYGHLQLPSGNLRAHRVAFFLEYGDPSHYLVCHSCDNKSCCNPNHLFLGTQKDNMRDAKRKGRNARGERHSKAKLTQKEVDLIRAIYKKGARGYGTPNLAKRFGVSTHSIYAIVNNWHWRDA